MFVDALLSATEVDCGTLSAPTNGEIILSGTTFGFTATYSCNKGFTAVGSLTRICQINSLWSGQEPTCIGRPLVEYNYSVQEPTCIGRPLVEYIVCKSQPASVGH